MMIRHTYNKIGFKKSKSGKCPTCGKRARRTEEFYQTQNPWNKKTVSEILKEENKKYNEWKKLPVYHAKCEK